MRFKQLLKDARFHFYNFDDDVRELLLWINKKNDNATAGRFFDSLNYESKVTGYYEPYFTKFSKYALARKEYIVEKFKDQAECETHHEHLKELFLAAATLDIDSDDFKRLYPLPPIAVPDQVPIICLLADKNFVEKHFNKRNTSVEYNEAAEACRPFTTYTRMGIDGAPISYDKFYEGSYEKFMERVFHYVAEQLRPLSKEQREENYKCAISPKLLTKFKEEIDNLI